jgi:hypothetical protein
VQSFPAESSEQNKKAFALAKTFGTEGSLEEASNKNYFFFLAAFFAAFFFVAM